MYLRQHLGNSKGLSMAALFPFASSPPHGSAGCSAGHGFFSRMRCTCLPALLCAVGLLSTSPRVHRTAPCPLDVYGGRLRLTKLNKTKGKLDYSSGVASRCVMTDWSVSSRSVGHLPGNLTSESGIQKWNDLVQGPWFLGHFLLHLLRQRRPQPQLNLMHGDRTISVRLTDQHRTKRLERLSVASKRCYRSKAT